MYRAWLATILLYKPNRSDFVIDKLWKVYVHTNLVNGKKYVGITSRDDPNIRWQYGRGYTPHTYFGSAIKKYGWDGFSHEVITDGLSETEAKEMESKLISEWKTQDRSYGYNMTSGGDGTRGYIPSAETRAKLSEARKRENLSEETLRRRSDGLRGRKFSEEHKKKIGIGNSKPIEMCDRDGEVICRFSSAREAEVSLGISHSHISQCCHGRRSTAGGYCWRFVQ